MLPSNELQPWLIAVRAGESTSLACWQVEGTDAMSLAMFSSDTKAVQYAEQSCRSNWQIIRPERNALIQVLIDSYRAGITNAVLDPSDHGARTFFSLRDVLEAAKTQLASEKSL